MEQEMRRLEIDVIPATVRAVESGGQIKKQKNLRVAAYCRVSTGDESQQTSYTTQKRFYTQLITSKPGWTMAGIYADEAISGTSRAKRKQFNEMMQAALAGNMDYIVTKSISRFARNTIDTLDCVRQLRQANPPVGIYFEKENIDTLDATGELILTILSALAQDESRSISDNIRWSIQRKFQRGEAMVDLNRMLGYDKGPDGQWVINQEQAELVRYIFRCYVSGISSNAIAKELNAMGKKTVRGSVWRADSVLYILRNEKYVGDCENQKYITKNFLTHEATLNQGEAVKYYVNNHHVPIIDRLTWNKVQAMLLQRCAREKSAEPQTHRGSRRSVFANLTCGKLVNGRPCGEKLFRIGYHNTLTDYTDDRSLAAEGINPEGYRERYYYYYPVWRCGTNKKNPHLCTSGSVYECALEQSFMEHLYWLKRDLEVNGDASWLMKRFASACQTLEQESGTTSNAQQRLHMLQMQICELEERLKQTLELRLETADKDTDSSGKDDLSQVDGHGTDRCQELIQDLYARMDALQKERNGVELEQSSASLYRNHFDFFLRCLKTLPETNHAGMPLNVNGRDVQGSALWEINGKPIGIHPSQVTQEMVGAAPDYLNFEKGIYMAFIQSGVVKGDVVEYQTNFGVTLVTIGNSRTLSSFLGFRRANPDKTVTFLDEKWKVSGRNPCYTRKKRQEQCPIENPAALDKKKDSVPCK